MNIKPLSDLLVIRPDPAEEMTAGGIVLAKSSQEEAKHGTVVAVGPGKLWESGYLEPMDVKIGDRVAFSMYAKETFKYQGETLLTCHQADIIGVLDE